MFDWCEQCEKSEVIINNLIKENAELKEQLRLTIIQRDAYKENLKLSFGG